MNASERSPHPDAEQYRPARRLQQDVPIRFTYPVYFVEDLFGADFGDLEALITAEDDAESRLVLFVLDEGVVRHHPDLLPTIERHESEATGRWRAAGPPIVVPGGEAAKNDPSFVTAIHDRINTSGVCRHSYVVAVGGGAVLDLAGYAAATAHRGVRLIRIPTTVLAQNDSGVGVKNGVNAYGKKNFVGTFAPPFAVFNDFSFLDTLDDRDWRAGTSEAVKVALIKDPVFFQFLEANAEALAGRDREVMQKLVFRCAELHLDHIRSAGDPFEMGSSRPLDFGHWSAHKLEQLSEYEIRHGEAVAIGIALESTYSYLSGLLGRGSWLRVLDLLEALGFEVYAPELLSGAESDPTTAALFEGLEEFREHLGGRLTILLLEDVGRSVEVHSVDRERYIEAIQMLRERTRTPVSA